MKGDENLGIFTIINFNAMLEVFFQVFFMIDIPMGIIDTHLLQFEMKFFLNVVEHNNLFLTKKNFLFKIFNFENKFF